MTPKEIELLEQKYLNKYYYFLKFAEDELLQGFQTMFRIKNDWIDQWEPDNQDNGKGISSFATGAERIVYSLLNGKGIGEPNSSPVGSDLFFEVEDAFIHIDLKTVQTRNIGDYTKDIFVGNNQNSFNGRLSVGGDEKIYDSAALPEYYTIETDSPSKTRKPCLTYFITILYEENNLDILNLNILSMPNGSLSSEYGIEVLKAGKVRKRSEDDPKYETHRETVRFKFQTCNAFKLLDNNTSRVKVVFFKKDMDDNFKRKLSFFEDIYTAQNIC